MQIFSHNDLFIIIPNERWWWIRLTNQPDRQAATPSLLDYTTRNIRFHSRHGAHSSAEQWPLPCLAECQKLSRHTSSRQPASHLLPVPGLCDTTSTFYIILCHVFRNSTVTSYSVTCPLIIILLFGHAKCIYGIPTPRHDRDRQRDSFSPPE